MRIALISCVSKKQDLAPGQKVYAKDLYISSLFKKAWTYAEKRIKPDRIYILSAEHHLLSPDTKVGSYNKTLNTMTASERNAWASKVLDQMRKEGLDIQHDTFYLLAGKNYYKYLVGKGGIEKPIYVYEGCKGIGYILHLLDS